MGPERLVHPEAGVRTPSFAALAPDPLDVVVAAGAVERLAGHGGHQFDGPEASLAGGVLADLQDQAANAAAGEIRVRVHGADASGVCRHVEQGCVAL